ncbi:predicted protein [Chaetoceros tenuissimus]|uniref:Uncharacterized protein n=1 Tax=Chaetoceros tenuissimus TaxID=426638 RepID=A0AAD3CZU5_9STRA|nr:predicted protein [Chaetoceros tenuissimus]
MSFLQQIEKAEGFLQKLKALIDINDKHLHDNLLVSQLEAIDAVNFSWLSRETTAEEWVSRLVANALTRLCRSQPPVEVVEKLIDMFPTALDSTTKPNDWIPLQHAANSLRSHAKYIHLFVTVSCSGYLRNCGPNTSASTNILQYLLNVHCHPGTSESATIDESLANTIGYFCKQGFITKEDIENYDLLARSCHKHCMRRFECLARWHKEALKNSRVEDEPLLHHLLSKRNFDSVEVFLRASFQLFPNECGLLFYGDYSDQDHVQIYNNVLEYSSASFYKTLEKVIRPISFPLLHQLCKHGGQLLGVLEDHLPFLCGLLDEDGRSYHQALFAHCPEQVTSRIHFLLRPRIDRISLVELETKDPVTGLLPFMTVVANGSVECIYKVLLKHPAALLNCIKSSGGQKGGLMTLKRKHDNTD